jgi:hypothetical protein
MGGGDFHGVKKNGSCFLFICPNFGYEMLLGHPEKEMFPAKTQKMEGTNGPDPLLLIFLPVTRL